MSINDCKEFGSCDWKLTVYLGNSQEGIVLVNNVEADSNEDITLNKTFPIPSFPFTVNCRVQEHDGGIGAGWEFVGEEKKKITGPGEYYINLSNNEGDVTIHFTVYNTGEAGSGLSKSWLDTKQAIGVFRAGAGDYKLITGEWTVFQTQWIALSKKGLRLIDLETHMEGANRLFTGVFRAGNDAHYLWVGVDYKNFVAKWEELSKSGLRLIDLETYVEGNQRLYAGVFRAGNDAHYMWVGVDYKNFVAKWEELSKKGLRLIDLETYVEGNQRLYAGVFRAGNDGYYLWQAKASDFLVKYDELCKKGFRLTNIEIYPE